MNGRLAAFGAIVLALWPAVAAADLVYCATDDKWLKLSVETMLSDDKDKEPVRFRGAMLLKQAAMPGDHRAMRFNGSMMRRYWGEGDDVKLRLSSESRFGKPLLTLDIDLGNRQADIGRIRFSGSYSMVLDPQAKPQSGTDAALKGQLLCQVR
ncbi:hypothetical protein J5J10_14270 [Ciceribacter sp. L1K23]|uniref:hypothetical protein n=1 Tax=unclassified Ciceribacter TaxID=2628820 RepID=UPI001ABDA8F7|nr:MULTISPECIES: hypothetical protein [unclassified Ciceribacter]MBO3759003.1 hypothetical protein [Ciceribacter sp. L1K22]MBR0556850.1 hypothetical protein [Ciceribacter sp. L1K23]